MIRLIPLFALFISGILGTLFNLTKISKIGAIFSFLTFVVLIFFPESKVFFNWFDVGKLKFNFSFNFDETGILICAVVTSILSCLYFAKKNYEKDKTLNKKLSILNIFAFFMCMSVLSDNMLLFFIGIEELGLISTLLIGMENKSETQATKVFLFNKFASLLFLIATAIISINVGSFEFDNIKEFCNSSKSAILSIPALILLISCLCKGAQMPFSYWLIDAVKANTFVSILIHAGTIVAIGIIFITKCYFIFETFPYLKKIMIAVGLYTSFWMSCCALSHTNIKKIIACLTAASSGIMFISCGIGAYSLAILYFICHAFFKSMLFLSFAYVMSSMSGEQNLLKMGGLNKFIPKINDVVWISFLAAAGFPFFVGFFAKISFVSAVELSNMGFLTLSNIVVNIISIAAIFRMILISMYGKPRTDETTLSRCSSNASSYEMRSIWVLIIIAVFGSFIAWSMYEWGVLNFGFGGVVYTRNFLDYFIENSIELLQIGTSLTLVFMFMKYSKTRLGSGITGISATIFRRNEIYLAFSRGLKDFVIFVLKYISISNQKFETLINKGFIKGIFTICLTLKKRHKQLIFSHTAWILSGVIMILISILFWRS